MGDWNPEAHEAWASVLGLVRVPLFGPGRDTEWPGENSVLLDGPLSSFAMLSRAEQSGSEAGSRWDAIPSWSWSADLLHTLVLDEARGEIELRRWDRPEYRRFRFPKSARGAQELLDIIDDAPAPVSPDVVHHVLWAFRMVRTCFEALAPQDEPRESLLALNALLLLVEAVRQGRLAARRLRDCSTFGDAYKLLGGAGEPTGTTDLLSEASTPASAAVLAPEVIDRLLGPAPVSHAELEPGLLLRHAAGRLYQEAHLLMERRQLHLAGMGAVSESAGLSRRDVRLTPPAMARALVQQAMSRLSPPLERRDRLDVLDPACGSGVFLQEALRELESRGFRGNVVLRGLDVSELSCLMSRFSLDRAAQQAEAAGLHVEVQLRETDALVDADAWGAPDLVAMNPPFRSWQEASAGARKAVTDVLAELVRGRVDTAMAFVWRALQRVRQGGAVSSVIPAPLLDNDAGLAWRRAIADLANIEFIGRIEGYGYFAGAAVEPALLTVSRPRCGVPSPDHTVSLLRAQERSTSLAIRGMRVLRGSAPEAERDGWELAAKPQQALLPETWNPVWRRDRGTVEALAGSGLPTVGEMFAVHQGARTGANDVFMLSSAEYDSLPADERPFFRPAVTNRALQGARLSAESFVFYPYSAGGLELTTVDDLRARVPKYLRERLEPARARLSARQSARGEWWELSEPRSWQHVPEPKLVTKYFGASGGFAYDEVGHFVVVQGHAWLWKRGDVTAEGFVDDEREGGRLEEVTESFAETALPWAFLALLNSAVFEAVLASACPRVSGGQFNLSARFVSGIRLPDLADESAVSRDLVAELEKLGRRLHAGEAVAPDELAEAASRAYGLPSGTGLSL